MNEPLSEVKRVVVALLALVLVGGTVAWVLGVPRMLGVAPYTEQMLTFALALALAILFLEFDWRGRRHERLVWFDVLLGLTGFLAAGYLTLRYPELVYELIYRPLDGVIVTTALVFLTIEGVRRSAGLALALVLLGFIAFGLLGHLLPAAYATRDIAFTRLMIYLGSDTNGLLGIALQVGVIVIVPFILLGKLLARVGGSDFFTELAMALMGRFRGGSGKIAIVGSTLFGSVSGSAVANVAGTGVVTIPLMRRSGFPPQLAGGVEAVASTGSQLMPPVIGAAAFLMAEFLRVPYGQVMMAALIPILLYYAALFIQVDLLAARMGLKAVPKEEIPPLWPTLRAGWYFPLPFVVFLVGLFRFNLQAEVAALWAVAVLVVGSTLFGYKGRRPGIRTFGRGVIDAGRSAVEIILITAGAGFVIGVLNLSGMAFSLSIQILALSGENLAVLLLMAAGASIILGMGMPTVGVYVLLATLIAPAIIEAGVAPLAAHLFVLYFGMLSMVTPPIALAAFTAANLASADPWRTSLVAVRLGWTAYLVPFLFVMSPALLLIGSAGAIVMAVVTALAGVWMVSVAMTGYLSGRVPLWLRGVFAVTGLMVLIPSAAFDGALTMQIAGLVAGALAAAYGLYAAQGPQAGSIEPG